MDMKKWNAVMAGIICSGLAGMAHADREGLYLGFGLGGNLSEIEAVDTGSDEKLNDSLNEWQNNVKLGAYLSDQFALYYYGYSNHEDLLPDWDNMSYFHGIGGTVYLSKSRISPYIEGAFGVSGVKSDNRMINASGYGYMLGAGLEITPFVQVGLTYTRKDMDSDNSEVTSDDIAAKVELKLH